MIKRFSFGGDSGKDQRIYYFNTKEITDNKFGNISQFILADHIRSGKIDKSLLLKDNEDSAIVVILFESENKKLDEAIRSIGNNIYAEYFKYELN